MFGIGPPAVPARYISKAPVPSDGTMLYLDAVKDWDLLKPETRQIITDFMTPQDITSTLPLTVPTLAPCK